MPTPPTPTSPLPWRVERYHDPKMAERRVMIHGAASHFLADVYDGNGAHNPHANAALIVRAVNAHAALVAALRTIIVECADSDGRWRNTVSETAIALMLGTARAALALAGEGA